MTKQKSTKRALLMSFLSLLLCVSMLIGTTFAWFTDSVTSGNNIIKSGTLDVTMEWFDGTKAVPAADSTDWIDASTGAIFNSTLWEPGYTEVRHIKIANEGTLALKYQLNIIANGTVSKLADVIDVYYVDPAVQVADRAALATAPKLGTLTEVLAKISETASGNLQAGENHTITLALKMKESAGNEYQDLSIGTDFAVQLLATQLTSESDSFNNQYDVEADYTASVGNADDLAVALAAGGKVKLLNDITLAKTISVPAGVATVVEMNGKTITGTMHKNDGAVLKNNGTLIITGGTISSTAANGGSAVVNNGTLTVNGTTLNGASNADGSWPSYTVNNTGVMTMNNAKITSVHGGVSSYGTGAAVTLNNCELAMSGIPGFTSHGLYTYNNGAITVNGGVYANNAADQNATGGSVINGSVTVNSGTFTGRIENYYGTPVIKGGTYTVKPAAQYIAAGYNVVDNGNGTWTVKPYEVSNATELADAIAVGKAVILTQDVSLGKIDLTGAVTNDVVIDANGHKITTTDSYGIEATAGKNITVSNADVEMTKEGDYITYAAGFKIANGDYAGATITLQNCTITMANGDWAYAVNMPASVKNLNLVIDNCTLEGAIAVQCWGDGNTITITNSELICNYTTNALYTSYCVALQSDGTNVSENNTLVIDNCEFKYSGVDNFNSTIKDIVDFGTGNTVKVTNCTYDAKVVAD